MSHKFPLFTMKSFIIFSAVLIIVAAKPFVDKNTVKEEFLKRHKRDEVAIGNTKYGLKDGVPFVNHQVNLANSNGHKFDANAFASKDFHNNKPLITGGGLNYAHQPSGAGLNINAAHMPGSGTKLGANGVYNLYQNGGFGVNLKGGYSQQFGGPYGNGPPVYGVEIQGGYAFPKG